MLKFQDVSEKSEESLGIYFLTPSVQFPFERAFPFPIMTVMSTYAIFVRSRGGHFAHVL